jgi:purine-binding chemotaxis protein CheW
MWAVLIPLHGDWFAVAVDEVREVVPKPSVTPLPLSPDTVLGLFNVRGEVVPLLDTPALLGLEPLGAATYATVVTTPAGRAGLASDGLPETARLGDLVGDGRLPGTARRFAVGDRAVTMLDLDAMAVA